MKIGEAYCNIVISPSNRSPCVVYNSQTHSCIQMGLTCCCFRFVNKSNQLEEKMRTLFYNAKQSTMSYFGTTAPGLQRNRDESVSLFTLWRLKPIQLFILLEAMSSNMCLRQTEVMLKMPHECWNAEQTDKECWINTTWCDCDLRTFCKSCTFNLKSMVTWWIT